MQKTAKIIALLIIILITSCKKPLDHYNKAVYAGNMAISLTEMESRIERIQEGYEPEPIQLASRVTMRLAANEQYLRELKGFLGNSESDAMIKAAIAYIEYDISTVKNPETIKMLNALDKKMTPEELEEVLLEYEEYLDAMYDGKAELWETYDKEVSKYAKANDIKEKFYGPDLKPIDTKNNLEP